MLRPLRTLFRPHTLYTSTAILKMSARSSSSSSRQPATPLSEIVRPPSHPGMKELDRSAFDVKYPVLSMRVDTAKITYIRGHPLLRGYMMDLTRAKQILPDPNDPGAKLMRLRVQHEDQLPEDTLELIRSETKGLTEDALELDYTYWTASDVLNAILPSTSDEFAPSSFTQTGHIGHVNLREEWLPYRKLVGQVFLDKNPSLRTIVNKLDTIHAEYRYFNMEVLAGEAEFVTTTSESNCSFTFDFSKVYWNSRLQQEHDRLVSLLPQGSVIADVMAGVGPFAIPAAKKGCYVLGNDLNPESVRWMRENRVQNKVESTLRVSEIDGKEFIRQSARMVWDQPFQPWVAPRSKQELKEERKKRKEITTLNTLSLGDTPTSKIQNPTAAPQPPVLSQQLPQHYIMNLPDSALTFLGAFCGVLTSLADEPEFEKRLQEVGLPMVHVYCFTRELEYPAAESDICERATRYLDHPVSPSLSDYNLHLVRRVAPNKDMYCLSFRLPREVALAPRT